jgi:hypothetical protein
MLSPFKVMHRNSRTGKHLNLVLPKYNHNLDASYGAGPLSGWLSLDWCPADSEQKFDENWANPTKRVLLEKYGWTKTSIKYDSNRQGFRMNVDLNEVEPKSHDFYLGCSFTFGIGINAKDTWPEQMIQRNNRPGLNFGFASCSIETQYRLLRYWAPILKPRRVYTLGTFLGRREFLEDDIPIHVGNPGNSWKNFVENPKHELFWQSEIQISHIRAYDAIRAVCMDYDAELYSICDDKRELLFDSTPGRSEARDLSHPGPIWHHHIANLSDDYWERLA